MKKEIIQELLKQNNVEAIMLYSPQNRFWYTNFNSSLGYVFVTKKKSYLLLDGRYITAAKEAKAKEELVNVDEIIWFKGDLNEIMQKIFKENEILHLGFEADWLIYQDYENFKKMFSNIEFVSVDTTRIRMIKTDDEVKKIRKACEITDLVFQDVLQFVKTGMTELELAIFINGAFLKHGAEKLSFETIVGSGENGSKPHAIPTNKKFVVGEMITLDMGCYYQGYCSDQTRSFVLEKEPSDELKKIYDVVFEAQSLGISLLREGMVCADIHKTVDAFIAKEGYAGYFNHGLGHGIGIEIHERPYENPVDQEVLKAGMTVTVEPGIYIPNIGGVRIEDDFLITKTGSEKLTISPRELIIVK